MKKYFYASGRTIKARTELHITIIRPITLLLLLTRLLPLLIIIILYFYSQVKSLLVSLRGFMLRSEMERRTIFFLFFYRLFIECGFYSSMMTMSHSFFD